MENEIKLREFKFADFDIELVFTERSADPVQDIIDGIIKVEGGYTDNAADKGGPTKYGITQATLSAYLGRKATKEDVKTMSVATASAIYRRDYVKPFDFVDLIQLKAFLIDAGVNHGIDNAEKFLQRALGVDDDGQVGSGTMRAYEAADKVDLYYRCVAVRNVFYGAIVHRKPSQSTFIEGWLNRMTQFIVNGPR